MLVHVHPEAVTYIGEPATASTSHRDPALDAYNLTGEGRYADIVIDSADARCLPAQDGGLNCVATSRPFRTSTPTTTGAR